MQKIITIVAACVASSASSAQATEYMFGFMAPYDDNVCVQALASDVPTSNYTYSTGETFCGTQLWFESESVWLFLMAHAEAGFDLVIGNGQHNAHRRTNNLCELRNSLPYRPELVGGVNC